MKNFVQIGDVLDYVAKADVKSGELVLISNRVGVSVSDTNAGQGGALRVKGVASVPKVAAVTIAQGEQLYFDPAVKGVTNASGEGVVAAGYAAAASVAGAITVALHLNG